MYPDQTAPMGSSVTIIVNDKFLPWKQPLCTLIREQSDLGPYCLQNCLPKYSINYTH